LKPGNNKQAISKGLPVKSRIIPVKLKAGVRFMENQTESSTAT